ncbi:MAG: alpha-2-macroglobulin family protein [Caulobacterales bacterium]|uniref:alpha-2-macroglobulin family protein n=1 Tax=Glycocaulis sp. TaxID=1969725 RepID=UPI003FA15D3D
MALFSNGRRTHSGLPWRTPLTLAALAAALVVSACSPEPQTQSEGTGASFEPRAADAPRATAEVSSRFEYLRYAADIEGDAPRLCLTFSGPLDPTVDYSAYVEIDEPVALNVDGQRLCIGGLSFGQTRTLTLREGLPSADGRRLETEETDTLSFAARPAYVGFAGTGVILPRVDADGVAIETVNVDAVRVTVTRVTDRALAFRQITSGFNAASGDWYWMDSEERPGEAGAPVWEGEMDTPGEANALTTTVFPLAETIGTLRPGAYFLRAENLAEIETDRYGEYARAARWLIVTDLAFTAYRGSDGLDAVVRSLQSAQPQAGVEVQLIARSNEVLATVRSDAQGRVRFDEALVSGREGNAPRLLLAYGPEGDFAVLDLNRAPVDLSAQPVDGRDRAEGADGFIWLDRGIYRPGETIHASAMVRDGEGRALSDRPGTITLYAPNGLAHEEARFERAAQAGAVFHDFDLPREAARGRWRIAVTLDGSGEVASQSLSVEDFVPQRVALTLTADTETPIGARGTRSIETFTRFLYGAPGAGLQLRGTARIQPDPSPFPEFEGYRFGLHDERFAEEVIDLPETLTDGQGNAVIAVSPGEAGLESSLPLRARAVITVEEPGGRAVSDDVRIPYRPRETYVGIRMDAGEDSVRQGQAANLSLIALGADGAPLPLEADWRLIRTDWQYDWYRTDSGEWRWRRSQRVVPIESGRVRLDGESPASVETPSLDWGDYTLIVSAGGQDLASFGFWSGYGGRPEDGEAAPDRVRLSGPADAPETGDTAIVSIFAPYAGQAELVVATDRVILARTLEVGEGATEVELPVTEEWGAGAYVMVSVFTPRDAVTRPTPRRAVGVLHIPVNVEARTFEVTLDAPERIEPRQTFELTVTASDGPAREEAWVTVAAVDEGILLLTGFASPDPEAWFFGKARLGVDLLDDYGRLLDPNQGPAAPVRSGGDEIGGAGLSVVPTRTVALFSGPVRFDRQGRAQVSLDIPDFNGELRLMAVAWSDSGIGSASQPLTVRDNVPTELVLPRFLAPGDTASATLTMDNVDGAEGSYGVTVSAEGPVTVSDGSFDQVLDIGQRIDRAVTISASDAPGIAGLSISVEGPQGDTITRDYPIEVRSAFLPMTSITRRTLRPGESWQPPADTLAAFAPGSTLRLSVAATPIDTAAIYDALSGYPYGCTEQMVSRALPLLYAEQMSGLSGRDAPADADDVVRRAIESVLARQSEDGAFGLWRIGDGQASPWLGAYTTDFLMRAAEAGHSVPRAALTRALDALVPVARGDLWQAYGYDSSAPDPRWSRDTAERLTNRSSAYASFLLARAGRADRARLRYLHDEMLGRIESPLARAHVGAGLAALGDRARAVSAFDSAISALGYRNPGDWYQTPVRDLAGITALVAEAGVEDRVEGLVDRLARDLPEASRMTTQEQAHVLMAARAFAGDAQSLTVEWAGSALEGQSVVLQAGELAEGASLTNRGSQPVFVTGFARGVPLAAPDAVAEGVDVARALTDRRGNPVDTGTIRRGDQIIVALTITPQQTRAMPLIVADLLPAGFEIEGILRPDDAGETGPYAFLGELAFTQVAEARDDRFVAAINTQGRDPVRVAYMVRAVTPGEFTHAGTVVEDMYRPDVFARSAPGEVIIRP